MALKLQGKDDRLTPEDFRGLARTIGPALARADAALVDVSQAVLSAVESLALPAVADSPAAHHALGRVSQLAQERARLFV